MPRCPNCFYSLVLLEHRRKYKCAKCSGLFPQKLIEDKEFREWNRTRRKQDKKEAKREYYREYTQANKEKVKAWVKKYYEKNREKILAKTHEKRKHLSEKQKEKRRETQREWIEKNRESYNAKGRKYWAKHRERLLVKKRENYNKRKAEILEQEKVYRQNNKEKTGLKHLRNSQKKLAVRKFEFGKENGSIAQIVMFLLTFLLS